MTKIALLIIYNHRFDKNIARLEKLYTGKFSYIYHLMPFYDGEKENVIPVYASSYQFQSYIAQAYQHLKNKGFTHYFIVADDMIINPHISENNLFDETGIGTNQSYIYDLREIYECFAARHVESMRQYKVKQRGVEVEKILPSKEEAELRFHAHGLQTGSLTTRYLFRACYYAFRNRMLRKLLKYMWDIVIHNVKLSYPLVWAYSDVLLLPANVMDKFATYCGAFAATGLFVEYAIPTSLIFATNDIILDKDLKLHGIAQIYPKKYLSHVAKVRNPKAPLPLLGEEEAFVAKYNYNLMSLLSNFPEDIFFIHPIKLSKWHE